MLIFITLKKKSQHNALTITSEPNHVTIEFQEKKTSTPFSIKKLDPGNYSLKAYKDGWDFQEMNFYLAPNEEKQINIKLEKKGWSKDTIKEGAPSEQLLMPPLDQWLPYQADHFKVDINTANNSYLIVPTIPFDSLSSPEDQLQQYWSQYYQYGIEALNWIKSKGVDPASLKIEWWAQDWWPAGKTIP